MNLQLLLVTGDLRQPLLASEVAAQQRPVVRVARQHLKPQVPHLLRGLPAVRHSYRGIPRILRVSRRVVVRETHLERGSPRQGGRLDVAVFVLPVEVPSLDAQQRVLGPVGKNGPSFHLLSEIVRVRVDVEHLDIHRQHVAVFDHVMLFSRRDVDRLGAQAKNVGCPRRFRGGEVKAER